MSRNYAREKFGSAVEYMATSAQSLHDRLHSAYLMFSPVSEKDFADPREKEIFEEIQSILTREDAVGDEGRVRASLNKMTDDEASSLASLIVSLDLMLSSHD